jgi:hypothetical protein
MKQPTQLIAASLCVLVFAGGASAQTGDRLSDKEVKALLDAVDKGRDRFEDQLDGKLKDSILRLPNGEVNVARFLDDLQENTGRLKERFTSEYSASAEVAAVLRQSTAIDAFMKERPGIKGGSEWDSLAANLSRLAAVYGTRFPLAGDAPVRRVSDAEAAEAAATVEDQADQFKNAVNREQALAKPAKDGLKSQADLVKNAAKTLKSRLNDSKPATSEARQLFAAMSKMRQSAGGLSPASLALIGQMQAPLTTLSQAFGIAMPGAGT